MEGFPSYVPSTASAADWPAAAAVDEVATTSNQNDYDSSIETTAIGTAVAEAEAMASGSLSSVPSHVRHVRNRDDSDQHLPISLLPTTALGGSSGAGVSTSTSTNASTSSWPQWTPSDPSSASVIAQSNDTKRSSTSSSSTRNGKGNVDWPVGVPMPASFNANDIVIPGTLVSR
jgi:hypothetical protein